jgi:hypothetical protein
MSKTTQTGQVQYVSHIDDVVKRVETAVIGALNEFGGRMETTAKGSIGPGRGVVTGTYRRSLHFAPVGYNFGKDHVKPSKRSPERSGKGGGAKRTADSVGILFGSGMRYAMKLEQRYNVVQGAMDSNKRKLPEIVRKHAKTQGLL